jgi:hypothetical protein
MSRRDLAREVLDDEEFAEYLATVRHEAPHRRNRTHPANPNSDGWDGDDFYGIPGHWDDWTGGDE